MPANKEAFIRYRIIDKLLRNKRKTYPSMDDFIEEMEEKLGKTFSESTVQKDIKAMKQDNLLGYMAPIKWSKREGGYYYSDENFTITEIPLSEDDIDSLEFAATVLQQFKGVKMFSDFEATVDKIFNAINVNSMLSEDEIEETIQFEKVPYFKGSNHIGKLLEYIKARNCISISYKKFDSEETKTHKIHPYLLKEYRNRWYLIGMNNKNGYINTFGLDRIAYIDICNEQFKFHKDFSSKTYFDHAFGITTFEGEAQELKLAFNKRQKEYIKTQPLHETQEIISETDDELIIKIKVGLTIELKMHLLSFGENVKVLAPKELQKQIKEKLQETLKQY
ncbi:MAG: helix-turn-helix transcriptional regulator [Chitinophagales bacterium]